jgi:hypothetical protein
VGTYLPEGSGTETNAAFLGAANDIRVSSGAIPGSTNGTDGVFTSTPNKSHGSYPGTPTLASISPTTSAHGGAPVLMTLTGTNFDADAQIYINGLPAAPAGAGFQSETQMIPLVQIPAVAGSYSVTVVTDGYPTTPAQTWTIT